MSSKEAKEPSKLSFVIASICALTNGFNVVLPPSKASPPLDFKKLINKASLE